MMCLLFIQFVQLFCGCSKEVCSAEELYKHSATSFTSRLRVSYIWSLIDRLKVVIEELIVRMICFKKLFQSSCSSFWVVIDVVSGKRVDVDSSCLVSTPKEAGELEREGKC
jgi:hypothetical protein